MELREYLKVAKIYWAVIVLLTLFGAFLGYFYTRQLPTGFRASQTFFLAPAPAIQSNLEANNAQEMARNFTDTAVAIIISDDFKNQILEPGQALTIKKNAPQVLTISTFAATGQQAASLLVKTQDIFNSRFASPGSALEAVGTSLSPQVITTTPRVYATAGALLGLAFAIFAISLKTYLKL